MPSTIASARWSRNPRMRSCVAVNSSFTASRAARKSSGPGCPFWGAEIGSGVDASGGLVLSGFNAIGVGGNGRREGSWWHVQERLADALACAWYRQVEAMDQPEQPALRRAAMGRGGQMLLPRPGARAVAAQGQGQERGCSDERPIAAVRSGRARGAARGESTVRRGSRCAARRAPGDPRGRFRRADRAAGRGPQGSLPFRWPFTAGSGSLCGTRSGCWHCYFGGHKGVLAQVVGDATLAVVKPTICNSNAD